MKPGERILNFRAVIARGAAWMALLGLVACATTTTPVSRQADPAFARKVVTYSSPVPPGTIVIDPANHFLYLVQSGGQAIRYGVGVGEKALDGRARLAFTRSRNGRTGIHLPKCCSGSPSSENT